MRRLIYLVLLFMFLLCASAEGLLPMLDDIYGVTMPSVRAALDRNPDEEEIADGTVVLTFNRVSEENYEDIRQYFADYGCTYDRYEVHGMSFDVEVKKGSKSFTFTYDYLSETAKVYYPIGANEEKVSVTTPISVGDVIRFGTYPQMESGDDETPIEWNVLACEEDKVLIISRYVLDCVSYNTKYEDVTWETCSLRSWLNDGFYNRAFSPSEKQSVVRTRVSANKNPRYDTDPGNDTTDSVFLLSSTEVNGYLGNNNSYGCAPTDYAVKNGVNVTSSYSVDGRASCNWWLRSPGSRGSYAAYISKLGTIAQSGGCINGKEKGVRPCVWVRTDADYSIVNVADVALVNADMTTPSPNVTPKISPMPTVPVKTINISMGKTATLNDQQVNVTKHTFNTRFSYDYYARSSREASNNSIYLIIYYDWKNTSGEDMRARDILVPYIVYNGIEREGLYYPYDGSAYPDTYITNNVTMRKNVKMIAGMQLPMEAANCGSLKVVFKYPGDRTIVGEYIIRE